MHPRRVLVAASALPLALLALLATACQPKEPEVVDVPPFKAATTTVEVHFTDSSVPPEHHRSWDLSADQDQIRAEVTSYETPIADHTASLEASEWESMTEAFGRIASMESVSSDAGCAGGTSLSVDLADGDRSSALDISACGGDGHEQLEEVLELLAPLTDAVELQRLIDTEYDDTGGDTGDDTGAGETTPPSDYADAVALFEGAQQEAAAGEFLTLPTESFDVFCSVGVEGIGPACEVESGLAPEPGDECAPGGGRQEIGRTGFTEEGIAEAVCNSDTIIDHTAPAAFDGTLVTADDVRCYVGASDVTCANDATTSGFYLSATEYRTW